MFVGLVVHRLLQDQHAGCALGSDDDVHVSDAGLLDDHGVRHQHARRVAAAAHAAVVEHLVRVQYVVAARRLSMVKHKHTRVNIYITRPRV